MSVRIHARLSQAFNVELLHDPSSQRVQTDPPKDNGGEGKSFSPTDLLASAYASCMLTIAAMHAAKHSLDIAGMSIVIDKHMSTKPPRKIAKLSIEWSIPDRIPEDKKAGLIEAGKNCPVALSIHPDIEIDLKITFYG